MMKRFGFILVFAAIAAIAAETINLGDLSAWKTTGPKGSVEPKYEGGKILLTGKTMLIMSNRTAIDGAKKYTYSLKVKNIGTNPVRVLAGFETYKGNRPISCNTAKANINSYTTVAVEAKKGDAFLIIKDGSKWDKRVVSNRIAFNCKEDFTDCPNFNLGPSVQSVEQQADNTWKVTFKTPLNLDVAVGTAVSQHYDGGYIYTAGDKTIAAGQEMVLSGTITGIGKPGAFEYSIWPYGAEKFCAVILCDWNNKIVPVEITEAKIVIE